MNKSSAGRLYHPLATRSTRRDFLVASAVSVAGVTCPSAAHADQTPRKKKAQIAITLDLEMSRHYPRREMTEWDYQKGNLDEATKRYAVEAARIAKERDATIHFFCVGRVLEQDNIEWIQKIAKAGHPIGNHTYDHVNVLATKPTETQFRFRRSPWLVRGMTARQVIQENIHLTELALQQRVGIKQTGFRTPGGFANGLTDREDIQRLLLDAGFKWVSSKYPRHQAGVPKQEPSPDVYADIVRAQRESQPFIYPSGLIEIPMSPISDVNAFRSNFWKLSYFLEAVRMSVEWAIETGGVFDFIAHPSCLVVEDSTFETIKLICKLVHEAGDKAAIVDLDAIAESVVA